MTIRAALSVRVLSKEWKIMVLTPVKTGRRGRPRNIVLPGILSPIPFTPLSFREFYVYGGCFPWEKLLVVVPSITPSGCVVLSVSPRVVLGKDYQPCSSPSFYLHSFNFASWVA